MLRCSITVSNVTLRRTAEADLAPTAVKYEHIYVSGRQIVFVHIPDDVNVARVVDGHVRGLQFTALVTGGFQVNERERCALTGNVCMPVYIR